MVQSADIMAADALNNYFIDFVDATNSSIEFENSAANEDHFEDHFVGHFEDHFEGSAADAFFADAAHKGSILFAAYNDASIETLDAMNQDVVDSIEALVNYTRGILGAMHDETAGKIMMLAYRMLIESDAADAAEADAADADDAEADAAADAETIADSEADAVDAVDDVDTEAETVVGVDTIDTESVTTVAEAYYVNAI
jgi:hypothetical protein